MAHISSTLDTSSRDIRRSLKELHRAIYESGCILVVGSEFAHLVHSNEIHYLIARIPFLSCITIDRQAHISRIPLPDQESSGNRLRLFSSASVLFIGFDQADVGLEELGYFLNKLQLLNNGNRHWIFLTQERLLKLRSELLWRYSNVQIISYPSDQISSGLLWLLDSLIKPVSAQLASETVVEKVATAEELYRDLPLNVQIESLSKRGKPYEYRMADVQIEQETSLEGYYSYVSGAKKYKQELENQLLGSKKLQTMNITWHDGEACAGAEWKKEITNHLRKARIILLFINADYLASFLTSQIEMNTALRRHKSKEACVIPIIIGSCLWKDHEFNKLQYLPRDGKPVELLSRPKRAAVFSEIAKEIEESISKLKI
jgi:hypothetical protein